MKTRYQGIIFCICLALLCARQHDVFAQKAQPENKLIVHYKDSAIKAGSPLIRSSFPDSRQLSQYVNDLPRMLSAKGYPVASLDSIWTEKNSTHIALYLGTKYNWVKLRSTGIDKALLIKSGYSEKNFAARPLNLAEVDLLKERLLTAYENEGFPFASIYLDSVTINGDDISAVLTANKGFVYRIDSIRNFGKLKLNMRFLQQYLDIKNGSVYNRDKLRDVDRKLLELPYVQTVQSSTLNMLGSGSVLNLYIDSKKSSEVSAILGFLPDANNTGKFQLTGDVNLDLKNVFGAGEGLLLKYQALQPKSPRLNLGYEKPFIFRSPYGFNFLFELFKKDSSYLQVNAQTGISVSLSPFQIGKAFVQWQTTTLLQGGVDTNIIKAQKRLPDFIDTKSVSGGVSYELRKTNYRFNPRSGNEIIATASAGIRTIQKNNDIISLKTPGFNYTALYDSFKLQTFQLRFRVAAAHYFPAGKSGTFKAALNAGIYNSPAIFRNEVFQIGGYRLLRGFDEESIYATQFAVATAEYRSLLSLNSYVYGFTDIAGVKAKYQNANNGNFFVGAGIGIVYETKAGLLNLSLALGKRDDVPFALRQAAKIHFGYINYF